jgi:hypothetical protein
MGFFGTVSIIYLIIILSRFFPVDKIFSRMVYIKKEDFLLQLILENLLYGILKASLTLGLGERWKRIKRLK